MSSPQPALKAVSENKPSIDKGKQKETGGIIEQNATEVRATPSLEALGSNAADFEVLYAHHEKTYAELVKAAAANASVVNQYQLRVALLETRLMKAHEKIASLKEPE